MAVMLENLREGGWYGRISLHAICKHANSIACDRHWMEFEGLIVVKDWEGIRELNGGKSAPENNVCLLEIWNLLILIRICKMLKEIVLLISPSLLSPVITSSSDFSVPSFYWP